MATVRKLVTKLAFEADTSQAEKFERVIIGLKNKIVQLNKALKGGKEDERTKRVGRLANAFKRLRDKINSSKVGQAVKNFGKRIVKATKGFSTTVLPAIKKITDKVVGVFSGVAQKIKNNKLKIIGAIVAAAAAIRSATLRSAEVETLDIAIIGKFGVEGAKGLNDQIEKIKKDLKLGELFSAQEIKQGIVTAIQLGADPKTISRQIQDALLAAATTPGASFEEAMAAFTTFTFTGDEASLAKFSTFNRAQIEALKLAQREASNFTNERKEQILLQANALKRAERLELLEKVLRSTAAKISQVTGEIADGWIRAGDAVKDDVNTNLDDTLNLIQLIKKEGFFEGITKFGQESVKAGRFEGLIPGEKEKPRKGLTTKPISKGFPGQDKDTTGEGIFGERKGASILEFILGIKNKPDQIQEPKDDAPKITPPGIPIEEKTVAGKPEPKDQGIVPAREPAAKVSDIIPKVPQTRDLSSKVPDITQTRGPATKVPDIVPAPSQSVQVTQNITIDGNVVDVSRTEQSKMLKSLQSAIMSTNQMTFGANANRQ